MNIKRENLPLTNFDTEQSLAVIWQKLHAYQDDNCPNEWDEICTAMAWITDALAIPNDGELERISLVEAMEAAIDMNQAATDIQAAISTPELLELIEALQGLYEPI